MDILYTSRFEVGWKLAGFERPTWRHKGHPLMNLLQNGPGSI